MDSDNRNVLEDAFANHDYTIAYAWSAMHGVAHVDGNGKFVDCNQAYCEILNRSKGEIIGRAFQDFTSAGDIIEDTRSANDVVNGYINKYSMNKEYVLPDGKLVRVKLEVRRFPWDVREEFAHFVVHCYYIPEAKITFRQFATNKTIAMFVAGISASAGAISGNIDVVIAVIKTLLNG